MRYENVSENMTENIPIQTGCNLRDISLLARVYAGLFVYNKHINSWTDRAQILGQAKVYGWSNLKKNIQKC